MVATQKLAFPLGGRETQVTAAMLIHFAVIAWLVSRDLAFVSIRRAILLGALAALAAACQVVFVGAGFSLPSMLLMLAGSAMLVFVTPMRADTFRRLMGRFVLAGLGASALVELDWGAQAVGLPMPDLEALIPHPLVYFEYNYIQPVEWGSAWNKPNGLFFLETSHVSQFIAMAVVVEMAMFRRPAVAALLGGALASTLGVTGLILAGSSLPVLLARARPATVLAVVLALPAIGIAAASFGYADQLLRRTDEFSERSSSGYNRFVLPAEWAAVSIAGPLDVAVAGTGAGTMPKAVNDDELGIAGYAWPPYTKVAVEYGTFAFAIWTCFLLSSLFGHGVPAAVSWAAFMQYSFLNGSLNVPVHTIYCFLLCAGPVIVRPKIRYGPLRPIISRSK